MTTGRVQQRIRIARIATRQKVVTVVQVASHLATNAAAGGARHAELAPFFDEVVLIGFVGTRRHFYGHPLTVRRLLELPAWQPDWQDIPDPAAAARSPEASPCRVDSGRSRPVLN